MERLELEEYPVKTYGDVVHSRALQELKDIPAVPPPTSSFNVAAQLFETRKIVRKARD